MTATTFTLVTTVPRPRPRRLAAAALRAVAAFGGAAVGVALLGALDPAEARAAGIRNPRPEYAPGPG